MFETGEERESLSSHSTIPLGNSDIQRFEVDDVTTSRAPCTQFQRHLSCLQDHSKKRPCATDMSAKLGPPCHPLQCGNPCLYANMPASCACAQTHSHNCVDAHGVSFFWASCPLLWASLLFKLLTAEDLLLGAASNSSTMLQQLSMSSLWTVTQTTKSVVLRWKHLSFRRL